MATEEEERKRLEKERRRKEFEAKNKERLAQLALGKEKKKLLSKKERRELQERNIAAKASGKGGKGAKGGAAAEAAGKPNAKKNVGEPAGRKRHEPVVHKQAKVMPLFSHLPQFESGKGSLSMNKKTGDPAVHPAIVTLGLKYSEGLITGTTARVVSMMLAFKQVIISYSPPERSTIARDLDRQLKPMIQYLIDARPHSIPMGNAIKYLRAAIAAIPPDMTEDTAREELAESIDTYIRTNVTLAQKEIVCNGLKKIVDGDVILTFGRSCVIEQLLLAAHENGVDFKVVVVNARPRNEGQLLVDRLAKAGIDCVFILLTSISYMMESASKVFLGSCAMMSNGTLLGRAGTALVALMAKAYNRPVLVFCETHKFTERVQLDSICYNELGDPDDLVEIERGCSTSAPLYGWRDSPRLRLLNLNYDTTPQDNITMLVTEYGFIPPSSVPVIVREKTEKEQ
mmetsp:Transcript_19969/g.32920  ORF Transcript_19969/g.32920 Transcript_19969/m.32920 type:complete len:456 (+) Transcript_19969:29-1396(+)